MTHPTQIVTDAVAAIDRADWDAFIGLCDPVSLRRFKSDLIWQLSDHGFSKGISAEDLMEEMPDLPREVAEYNAAKMESYRDPALRLQLEISTVSSLDELKSLEPHEVMIRWLQARMPHREDDFSIRTWEPAEGMSVTEVRRLSDEEIENDVIYKASYVVLGSVRDGPDFAHVICRNGGPTLDNDSSEDYTTPTDEKELTRSVTDRIHLRNALCRRQPDGTWRLVAERNLFFLPMASIAA